MIRSLAFAPIQAVVAAIALIGISVLFYCWRFDPTKIEAGELKWSQANSGPLTFVQTAQTSTARHKKKHHTSDVQVFRWRNSQNLNSNFWKAGEARLIEKSAREWTSGKDMYIVGWRPAIAKYKCRSGEEVQMVHHLNVHGKLGREEDGERIVASYDRGAQEYHLPDGYGIHITPQETLSFETHYLKPPCWEPTDAKQDSSGIDLFVTDKKPRLEANLVGFYNVGMEIEPGSKLVDHISRLNSHRLQHSAKFLKPNPASLQEQQGLEILAVHLHTHDIAQSKYFEIIDKDGSVYFRSDKEPGGYGDEQQSFRNIKDKGWPRLELKPGQTLQQHCIFDTSTLKAKVHWGLDNGDEMCAPLMILGGNVMTRRGTLWSERDGFLIELGRSLREAVQGLREGFARLV